MRRRLILNIAALPEYDEAENYEAACAAKYVLNDDDLWDRYLDIHARYVTIFEELRKTATREPLTSEDIKIYGSEIEND